jgi:hypothetical protein
MGFPQITSSFETRIRSPMLGRAEVHSFSHATQLALEGSEELPEELRRIYRRQG